MTKDDIIRMAREARLEGYPDELERFANLVAAAEREACAKVCDELSAPDSCSGSESSLWDVATLECGDAIRARGSHAS